MFVRLKPLDLTAALQLKAGGNLKEAAFWQPLFFPNVESTDSLQRISAARSADSGLHQIRFPTELRHPHPS